MKFSISTEALKELVSRSVKGMGNNKLIPITELMLIQVNGGRLTLETTDATNYFYVTKDGIDCDDFYVVVKGDQFYKLVSRMTCDKLELEITGNALEVRGSGTYRIDIPLDEGEIIQYPDPVSQVELADDIRNEVHLSTIITGLNTCKSSLATTLENPSHTGYYAGDVLVTTNGEAIACLNVNIFGSPVLVSSEFMNLLGIMAQEKFSSYIVEDQIICTSADCVVYGRLMEGIEEFPIDGINNYVAQEMGSSCKVNKSALLSVLDRIILFVGTYDENAIYLTFTKDGLSVESKQSNGIETVPYTGSENFTPFHEQIDIVELISTIKSYPDDEVKIQYGDEAAIKFVAGNATFVLSLITEITDEEE